AAAERFAAPRVAHVPGEPRRAVPEPGRALDPAPPEPPRAAAAEPRRSVRQPLVMAARAGRVGPTAQRRILVPSAVAAAGSPIEAVGWTTSPEIAAVAPVGHAPARWPDRTVAAVTRRWHAAASGPARGAAVAIRLPG